MKIFLFFIFVLFSFQTYAVDYAILVEKRDHRLSIFKYGETNRLELVKTYPAVTGKESGNKVMSGDKKTPEGIYFTTHTREKEELLRIYGKMAEKYGPKAFVLNYPNFFDAMKNKTGSGIWIHGVLNDNRILNPFDTEGCVALNNKDVIEVNDYIEHFNTPVVIIDSLKEAQTPNKIFDNTEKFSLWLETWRLSWETGDFSQYAAYYSDQFQSDKKNKQEWVAYKRQIAEFTDKKITIQMSNPKVIELEDQLMIIFTQKYDSPIKKDEGRKTLYVHKENGEYKILSENFYTINGNQSLNDKT